MPLSSVVHPMLEWRGSGDHVFICCPVVFWVFGGACSGSLEYVFSVLSEKFNYQGGGGKPKFYGGAYYWLVIWDVWLWFSKMLQVVGHRFYWNFFFILVIIMGLTREFRAWSYSSIQGLILLYTRCRVVLCGLCLSVWEHLLPCFFLCFCIPVMAILSIACVILLFSALKFVSTKT